MRAPKIPLGWSRMAAVLSLLALAQGCGLIRPPEAPNTCRPHTLWHAQQPQPFPSGGTVAPATGDE